MRQWILLVSFRFWLCYPDRQEICSLLALHLIRLDWDHAVFPKSVFFQSDSRRIDEDLTLLQTVHLASIQHHVSSAAFLAYWLMRGG